MSQKIGNRLISSFNHNDLLLWGARSGSIVEPLGLTLNIGIRHEPWAKKLSDKRTQATIQIASTLSHNVGYCFFVILYPTTGNKPYFLVTSPNDQLKSLEPAKVKQNEVVNLIQMYFNTNFRTRGTGKPVNRATSDFFHDWARENIPFEYVRVNLDGLILDNDFLPTIILETKRSFYDLDAWKPYRNDARNYYLEYILAREAGLDFWTIYHIKNKPIYDDSDVARFRIHRVWLNRWEKWINYSLLITSAEKVVKLCSK